MPLSCVYNRRVSCPACRRGCCISLATRSHPGASDTLLYNNIRRETPRAVSLLLVLHVRGVQQCKNIIIMRYRGRPVPCCITRLAFARYIARRPGIICLRWKSDYTSYRREKYKRQNWRAYIKKKKKKKKKEINMDLKIFHIIIPQVRFLFIENRTRIHK